MSRPRKDGVEYFPFDVDFFNDKKIKLLKARFGAEGIVVYIHLLCEIYRDKGYYMEFCEDTEYLIAADTNIAGEKVKRIMSYLFERELFNKRLFESKRAVTSRGLQRRYQQAVKVRALKNEIAVRGELWLLNANETEKYIVIPGNNSGYSEKNTDDSGNYATKHSTEKHSTEKHSIAQQNTEENVCDEGGAALKNIKEAFSAIKRPNTKDILELIKMQDEYGEQRVLDAIYSTVRKGGKSTAYVRAVLSDNASDSAPVVAAQPVPPNAAQWQPRQYRTPEISRGSYPPTYSAAQLEEEFWDELAAELGVD